MKKAKLLVTMLLALVMSLALVVFASCGGTPIDTGSESTSGTSESVDGGSDEGSGETSGEDSGSTTVDETAPEITLSTEETQFNVNLGESFTLPTITVTDNVDDAEDIFVDISCDPIGAATIKDGVFTSNILGTYTITYAAVDSSDNEAFESITINVVSEEYVETYDVTGYDNIDALRNDGGIYKENFAKGMNSPLIKGAMQVGYIQAGANALTGNSIIMDYASMEGTSNQFFLSNVSPYLRSGKWTVTFDVKLVSGTGFSDFYFGYVKAGTVDSTDQQFNISDMTVGEVITLTYSQLITFDADTTYWFHFFKYQQNGDAVLALDNFTFKYEEKVYTEVTPTLEQLKAGFTYDWTNAYMAMSASEPMKISEIADENIKTVISSSEGFSDTVMHLTGGGQHNISILDRSKNPEFFQTGLVYEFEFTYYSVKDGGNYMIVLDGTSSNNAFWANPFKQGLNTAKNEYTIRAIDNAFTFYGEMDVYLGNLKITVSDPVVERTDYVVPTDAQMLAEGGYTWDWTENNIAQFASYKYEEISKMKDATLAAALTETGAFTSGYALRFNAHNNLDAMNGKLVAGNKYIVSFTAYVVSGAGNIAILPMDASFVQAGDIRFKTTDNTNGTVTYTVEFTAAESYVHMYFYALGEIEIYLANLTIAEVEPQEAPREDFYAVTHEDMIKEGGYTYNWAENNIIKIDANATYERVSKMGNTELRDALIATNAFTNDFALKFAGGGSSFVTCLSNALVKRNTYTISFDAYVVEQGSVCVLLMNEGKQQVDRANFNVTQNEDGTYKFSTSFVASAVTKYVNLYIITACELYIANFNIAEVEAGPETAQVTKSGVLAHTDLGNFNPAKYTEVAAPTTEVGFAAIARQFVSPQANYTMELFRLGSIVDTTNFVSAKFTIYYYVNEISGTGLMINIDNSQFPPIAPNLGYNAFTLNFVSKFDFFSLYVDGSTTASVTIGSIYYEVVTEVAEDNSIKVPADKLNAGNKGTVIDTPEKVAGAYGFGDKVVEYKLFYGMNERNICEVLALTGITGADKSVKFRVYYYVEPGYDGTLFYFDNSTNFIPLSQTSGYHVAEFTLSNGEGWFLWHINGGAGGTVYLGSVEYEIV